MSFSFCSSLDPPSPLFESLHCTNTGVSFPKAFVRFGRKDNTQSVDNDTRKTTVPRQLLPEHLHGSFLGKKQPEEANLKADFVRTLLIDNYDSYTYNIYQELSVINGVPPVVIRNDEWTWEEICYHLYVERAFDNVVLSPGPGSPTCPADIGLCLQVLQECKDIPILGVCLGHQALGYVHGARIVHASEPIHGRLSEIDHIGSGLFHNIPSGRNSGLKVVRYHSLVIDEKSLPKQLVPIAWTSSDVTLSFFEPSSSVSDVNGNKVIQKNAMSSYLKDDCSLLPSDGDSLQGGRVLMGIMHSTRPHYGLQFHPESVATNYGSQMFKNFRDITLDYCQGLRSSSRKHSDACMQVPHAGQPLRSLRPEPSGCQKKEGQHYHSKNIFSNSHASVRVENLKLKWKKLDGLISQVGGAGNIFSKMFGDCEAKDTFWLDSSSVEKGRARFSFMGGRGGSLWKQLTFKLTDQSDFTLKSGGLLSVEDAQGSATSLYLNNGFLDYLNMELQSFCCDEKDYDGLPFDFCGGYVGYLGYNLKVECGAGANCHYSSAPDACFFFADNFLVLDHCHGDVYVMSVHDKNTNSASWLDDTVEKLLRLKGSSVKGKNKIYSLPDVDCPFKAGFNPKKSKEQYMQDVEKCLRYIKDGESYELCLTTQMEKRLEELDALHLYFRLREQNPAPYAAWLNFSRDNLSICCSSPERFLRLDTSGILEAKPIKGTISRGSTPEHDEQLKMRLQYSEKDQAENLMIVDLLRNDLGRVCEPGSVHVPHLMEVESYATVHTMVSTIRGIKQRSATPVDCVKAAFPGGSMTGAPKLRSMEILDSIERCSRGIYSGSIGYFSINGAFDLNIVIRTVVVHEGEASIGAGGAIVALSKPEEEYEEMILKARAPARATIEQDTSN